MIKIAPLKLKRNEKILLFLAAGIVSVFLIQKFFLSGLAGKIKSVHRQVKSEELKLRTAMEIQKRKADIMDDYKKYKSYLENSELSDVDAVTTFLKDVERMAQESGVSIMNLSPRSEAVETADHRKYEADLRVEAAPDRIFDFLNRIQNNKFLIKIDKFSLSPRDETATILRLETTLSVTVI